MPGRKLLDPTTYTSLLQQGYTDKAGEPSKEQCPLGNMGALDTKITFSFFSLQDVKVLLCSLKGVCAGAFVDELRYKLEGFAFDDAIGIFDRRDPSPRPMPLGPTQTLTEMSTRNISWG